MNFRASSFNTAHLIVLSLGLAVLMQGSQAVAKGKSYVCLHPDKPGGWGALDLGCDANQFGDVKRMKALYSPLIFDRNPEGMTATNEYVTNVQATIKEIAREYYLKRVPNAKPATVAAWMKTAVAIGAHESMLSHYRYSKDKHFKFMTGDHLVSHGIMQVNQEFHANQGTDSSFDFVGNVVAALDYYFVKWNDSVQQKCYLHSLGKSPSLDLMLTNRARSAYSSYNSGSNFCRFTDLKATWARNDKHFFETLRDQPWKKYVTDAKRASPVNVKCLIDGDDLCAMAKPVAANFVKNRPLILPDGNTCVTSDGINYSCAADTRIFSCVAKMDPELMDHDPLKIDKLPATAKITMYKDREPICQQAVQGLFKVGQMLLLKKEVLMRDEVGGSPIGNTKAGRIYQVIDYELRLGGATERYYQIKTPNGTLGWIYGGDNDDRSEWVNLATSEDVAALQRADDLAKAEKAVRKATDQLAAAKAAVVPTPAPTPEPEIVVTGHRKPVATPAPEEDKTDDGDPIAVLPVKGSIIEIVRAEGIPMRAVPGENPDIDPLFQLYQKARFTVEEVKIKGTENQIYLRVTSGAHKGWIYVGRTVPENTVPQWIKIWQ